MFLILYRKIIQTKLNEVYDHQLYQLQLHHFLQHHDAVKNDVTAVGIIDGRKPRSVLFELFSDKGSGTLIRK